MKYTCTSSEGSSKARGEAFDHTEVSATSEATFTASCSVTPAVVTYRLLQPFPGDLSSRIAKDPNGRNNLGRH
jgi:hypothetical protein